MEMISCKSQKILVEALPAHCCVFWSLEYFFLSIHATLSVNRPLPEFRTFFGDS